MNKWKFLARTPRGFSLIEVLVAVVLMSTITAAVFQTYIVQHKNYLTQDDITTIQQNARASIDELTRQVRMAGYELPMGMDFLEASNSNPDTITLAYKNEGCDTYLSAAMPQPSAELKCATDVSCFEDGQWVFIFEPDSGGGEFFEITHVQPGSNHLQHNTMTLSRKYGKDAIILSVERLQFYVDNTTDPAHPKLMVKRFGQPAYVYADNITDLQFKYRLDNGLVVDVPADVQDIRNVQIEVTGRSNKPEKDLNDSLVYRFRTYGSSVTLRNLDV